ncbi:MAG: ATPase [Clostridia bacterium]|nr:ATPase [Clostridia bacterium]
MNVEELLAQIDEMVDKAWDVPLSGGKCMIEADKLRDIIDDIRAALPSEIRQAQSVVADRAEIVAGAKREAEAIIRKAEERAQAMIAQEEITRQAQQRAEEMLTRAQQKSREMHKGANDFAEDVLRRSEENLMGRVNEIRQARQMLRAGSAKKAAVVQAPTEE